MKRSPLAYYILAAICQTSGSSGAAMLGPFFMKAHGYSIALAGMPLVANGVGRVCSDLLSGIMATYFSPGALLLAATIIGVGTSITGYLFLDAMPVFLSVWILFGLTEAMFALAIRKVGFDQAAPERQGQVQGQMASALGIGFTLGPLLGGFVGKWLGPNGLFFLYAVPQLIAFLFVLIGGAHRYHRTQRVSSAHLWRGRSGSFKETALPSLMSCNLSVISFSNRRYQSCVSFFGRESPRYELGHSGNNHIGVAFDRYPGALQRWVALRPHKIQPSNIAGCGTWDPHVRPAAVRRRDCEPLDSAGNHGNRSEERRVGKE